jgi:hypothetical protein
MSQNNKINYNIAYLETEKYCKKIDSLFTEKIKIKMSTNYTLSSRGVWTEVAFSDAAKSQIIDFVMKHSKSASIVENGQLKAGREIRETKLGNSEIRDALFPELSAHNQAKHNAEYQIQQLLGRGAA